MKDYPPNFGGDNAQSVLEMLYGYYNQYNRMDTEEIKAGFEELYEKMTGMPLRDMDDIIDSTCTIVVERSRIAFKDGFLLGMMLAQELA